MHIEDWIRHLEHLGTPDAGALPPERTLLSGDRGEQRLWRACAGEPVDLAAVLAPSAGAPTPDRTTLVPGDGPLLAPDGYLAIEVWTECELSALHALHRLIRTRHPALPSDAAARLDAAVRWHLEHTQPDNSTNRPWALHVFLRASLGQRIAAVEPGAARFYAETLLHNMTATEARDEALALWILADAARELRLA
jgi:hypothetical protein